MIAIALSIALQCAAWAGTDYDCGRQWFEDVCVPELTSAACGDTGTALDAAMDVCENTMPWAPSAAQALCAEAIVAHRDAGIGLEMLATEF